MARTTMKELEAKVNSMEKDISEMRGTLSEIVKTLNSINASINSKPNGGKSSDGTKKTTQKKDTPKSDKTNGTLKNSKKGKTVSVTIEDGKGKGEGKKFIKIAFSEKPSTNVIDSMKLKGFKYFNLDKTWSAYYTDKKYEFAQSLIK